MKFCKFYKCGSGYGVLESSLREGRIKDTEASEGVFCGLDWGNDHAADLLEFL